MKHVRAFRIIVVALVVGVSFAAPAQQVPQLVKDSTITARIETAFLFSDHLSPFNINTTTVDGVVTLSGSVADDIQKELAGDLAASVDGVKEVVNKITVMPMYIPERPKRGWRQRVEDTTVTANVRSRLLYHKRFLGLKMDVETKNNVVGLHGIVPTEEMKAEVGRVAFETRGVDRVVNNLSVQAKEGDSVARTVGKQISDEWVEKRVETAILLNRHIMTRGLDVEVTDGVCLLAGQVDTEPQKELAGSIASNILGVGQVRNEIHVRPKTVTLEPLEPTDGADPGAGVGDLDPGAGDGDPDPGTGDVDLDTDSGESDLRGGMEVEDLDAGRRDDER